MIPFQRGDALQQPPPDLASYLFKNRIVYLGMSLVPAVTELLVAELLYLQYDDPKKPIYMYINSTGTTKVGRPEFVVPSDPFELAPSSLAIGAALEQVCLSGHELSCACVPRWRSVG